MSFARALPVRALVALSLVGTCLVAAAGTAQPATAACPINNPDCDIPTTYMHSSTLSVTKSSGTVTSDTQAGHAINCGTTCSLTDHQTTLDPDRPTDDWPTYTLTATDIRPGYTPSWTGCPAVDAQHRCVVTNDEESRTVSVALIDTTPPTAPALAAPAKVGPTTTISANSNDNSGSWTFDWTVDGAASVVHGPALSLTGYAAGAHVVAVRARDFSGNVSAAASAQVTLDKSVGLSLGVTPAVTNASVTLPFTTDADVPAGDRECGTGSTVVWAACTTPTSYTFPVDSSTADGVYTLNVKVRDDVGNVTTATRDVEVDRTVPAVALTEGPSEGSTVTTPTVGLSFTASDSNLVTVSCRLDADAVHACADHEDLIGIGEGAHTFTVTATDLAGNTASAVRHFSRQKLAASLSAAPRSTTYRRNASLIAGGLPVGATGTVTFTSGGTRLCGPVAVGNGTATCAGGSQLGAGSHTVTATYSGDDTYSPDTTTFTLRVAKAGTKLTAKPTRTRTAYGHRVTLVAKVSPAKAPGTVAFTQGGTRLCRATVRSGVATCQTSARLAKGLHRVVATYPGSRNYARSTGATSFRIT